MIVVGNVKDQSYILYMVHMALVVPVASRYILLLART